MMMMLIAENADEVNARSAPELKAEGSGRMIIRAPIKPMAVALQRRTLTVSFSSNAAKIVAKRGAVNDSAVASAREIFTSAQYQLTIDASIKTDRPT